MDQVAAVIIDIVRSRDLADRAAAQAVIRAAFARADATVQPHRALWATFADEFQAEYATVEEACAATGIARLALGEGVDVRFGIGVGSSREVEPGANGPVLDGDAWWRAREAIDEAERRAGKSGSARTWADAGEASGAINASLTLRDQVIATMGVRAKQVALGLIEGQTQAQIAAAEGITQSAVSQTARKSGAGAIALATSLWLGRQ